MYQHIRLVFVVWLTLGLCSSVTHAAGDPSPGAKPMPGAKGTFEFKPGANQLHSHGNDTGHPDTFDCSAWCKGVGTGGGVCQTAPAPPCQQSAICACFK